MYSTNLPFEIAGHVKIEDDFGDVLLDECNAVHPQNMARIIARSLSNENNYRVHRIAFGNGGTEIDAAFTITFKTPNDGQPPDTQTWESRLYNETYSEVIDDSNTALLGTDPGSAGPRVGTRAGGGANPASDPASVEHVSGPGVRSRELGLTSEVVVVAVLNPSEPAGQLSNDQTPNNIDSTFTFDELGLYTTGKPARDSAGTQDIDVSDKTSTDQTNLIDLGAGQKYDFQITIDGGTPTIISLVPPSPNPTYGDLCEAINNPTTGVGLAWQVSAPLPGGATASITDTTSGTYPSIEGLQTYGFLRFTSGTSGATSSVALTAGGTGSDLDLFTNLPGVIVTPAVNGSDKGVQNNAIDSATEQERLLTHLVFAPVLKAANRTLTITYTLTISVARTQVA